MVPTQTPVEKFNVLYSAFLPSELYSPSSVNFQVERHHFEANISEIVNAGRHYISLSWVARPTVDNSSYYIGVLAGSCSLELRSAQLEEIKNADEFGKVVDEVTDETGEIEKEVKDLQNYFQKHDTNLAGSSTFAGTSPFTNYLSFRKLVDSWKDKFPQADANSTLKMEYSQPVQNLSTNNREIGILPFLWSFWPSSSPSLSSTPLVAQPSQPSPFLHPFLPGQPSP